MKYMSEEEYMCCMKYKTSTSQSFQNVLPSFIPLFDLFLQKLLLYFSLLWFSCVNMHFEKNIFFGLWHWWVLCSRSGSHTPNRYIVSILPIFFIASIKCFSISIPQYTKNEMYAIYSTVRFCS